MDIMLLMVAVAVAALAPEDNPVEVLVDLVEEEKEEYQIREVCVMEEMDLEEVVEVMVAHHQVIMEDLEEMEQ